MTGFFRENTGRSAKKAAGCSFCKGREEIFLAGPTCPVCFRKAPEDLRRTLQAHDSRIERMKADGSWQRQERFFGQLLKASLAPRGAAKKANLATGQTAGDGGAAPQETAKSYRQERSSGSQLGGSAGRTDGLRVGSVVQYRDGEGGSHTAEVTAVGEDGAVDLSFIWRFGQRIEVTGALPAILLGERGCWSWR